MARWPQVWGNSTKLTIALLCCVLAIPGVLWAGSLQPPGPPAPTMRTLDSLGFDCPNDPPGTTNLLFLPVATFDNEIVTRLRIFNTGADPFGTIGQSGTCTINYYGQAPPSAVTTPSVAPGQATGINVPNFLTGYAIATCGFSYAHGILIVDIPTGEFAFTLPATVICSDRGPTAMGQGR